MAMAERSEWQHHDDQDGASKIDERVRVAEEQRRQAESRCFAAERRRLDAERRLEQVEALLEEALQAGARMRGLVGELSELACSLRRALEAGAAAPARAGTEDAVAAEHRAEMVDALASAVERLRARVDDVKGVEPESPYQNACTPGSTDSLRGAASSDLDLAPPSLRSCVLAPLDSRPPQPHRPFDRDSESDAAQPESDQAVGEPVLAQPTPAAARPRHKHSMSAIGRWRNRRKQRQSA